MRFDAVNIVAFAIIVIFLLVEVVVRMDDKLLSVILPIATLIGSALAIPISVWVTWKRIQNRYHAFKWYSMDILPANQIVFLRCRWSYGIVGPRKVEIGYFEKPSPMSKEGTFWATTMHPFIINGRRDLLATPITASVSNSGNYDAWAYPRAEDNLPF